jgi:DNA helicase HerA-like ATPase
MAILNFDSSHSIANIFSVDTGVVFAKVNNLDELRKLQVNQLIAIQSSKAGQLLIGLINKITRKAINSLVSEDEDIDENELALLSTENLIKITLIGTLFDAVGSQTDVFRRSIDSVPEIDAECYPLQGANITAFMSTISKAAKEGGTPLSIGSYSIDENAEAFLDGDKLFQRHAVVVGSTGSGKSWCVAKLIEQIADLSNPNCILFDIHGEYSTESFKKSGVSHYRVANPSDLSKSDKLAENILMLPYWLLTYEEMLAMLLDRSDNNAPNQAMIFSRTVNEKKREFLESISETEILDTFTIDSPIPYSLDDVLDFLREEDERRVPGARPNTEKDGPFTNKLTRFIQRLETKKQDKRLGFLFGVQSGEMSMDWLNNFCNALMKGDSEKGVKVIDFSEVPSDILPLIISLVGRIIFSVQQWTSSDNRHPISLFCDEAHLYIPEKNITDSVSQIGLNTFERIAKEGRKYGLGLVVISQRPSEVNKTVMSQCNNFIALRLTNVEDQSVIKRLLPDNLAGLTDIIPILDIGEALVVGDASLLPTRINIKEPKIKPSSATIEFWKEWDNASKTQDLSTAIKNLRMQSK